MDVNEKVAAALATATSRLADVRARVASLKAELVEVNARGAAAERELVAVEGEVKALTELQVSLGV